MSAKENMKPVVVYISKEERDALDALVEVQQLLQPTGSGERVTRTSVARALLRQAIPSKEATSHALEQLAAVARQSVQQPHEPEGGEG